MVTTNKALLDRRTLDGHWRDRCAGGTDQADGKQSEDELEVHS